MDMIPTQDNERVRKAMLRTAGHALRSPLSVIYQTTNNLTDDDSLNPVAMANVTEISSSTERMLTAADKVIRLLQVMNCVNDGQPRMAIRLSEAATRAHLSLQTELTELGCGVVMNIPIDLPNVAFSSGIALQQLIQTVLVNVAKYAVSPIVYLSCRVQGSAIVVSVGNSEIPETERMLAVNEFLDLQRDDLLALDVYTSHCLLQQEGCGLWMTATEALENICWNFTLVPA